jgi:hypothetical protein
MGFIFIFSGAACTLLSQQFGQRAKKRRSARPFPSGLIRDSPPVLSRGNSMWSPIGHPCTRRIFYS